MSRTPKRLGSFELTTTTALMYEAPEGSTAQVAACTVSNKTGTAQAVTVTLTPDGEDALNLAFEVTVPPNTQLPLYAVVGQVVEPGDAIHAFADANSAIDFVMAGFETY